MYSTVFFIIVNIFSLKKNIFNLILNLFIREKEAKNSGQIIIILINKNKVITF